MNERGIVIVDYGLGNPAAVRNMLRKAGVAALISSDHGVILAAKRLILPGVGAFDEGMRNLADRGLIGVLHKAVLEQRRPVLGICLGMQLMTRGSEEGELPGLGWIAGATRRFRFADDAVNLRVPHMGWNTVRGRGAGFLGTALAPEARFYFVHSYQVQCEEPSDIALTASYGGDVVAGVARGNIAGTQFHPEKSHRFGLDLLAAFAEWEPARA